MSGNTLKNSAQTDMAINSTLKVVAFPVGIVTGDTGANMHNLEAFMTGIDADTDVVVLPELFSTGFIADKGKMAELAETNTGETITRLKQLSRRYNVAIAGSFLANTASSLYNRAFFIEPSGDETFYDKRHLFGVSAEASIMKHGGATPPVVRFRGWNIAMIVCYDLRFPVWCRNTGNRYDLLLVVANWPEARAYAWKHLLIARAIENQAYVIGANRGGHDEFGDYDNLTYIFDYLGRPAAEINDRNNAVQSVLDKVRLNKFRENFPVWKDCDSFELTKVF